MQENDQLTVSVSVLMNINEDLADWLGVYLKL